MIGKRMRRMNVKGPEVGKRKELNFAFTGGKSVACKNWNVQRLSVWKENKKKSRADIHKTSLHLPNAGMKKWIKRRKLAEMGIRTKTPRQEKTQKKTWTGCFHRRILFLLSPNKMCVTLRSAKVQMSVDDFQTIAKQWPHQIDWPNGVVLKKGAILHVHVFRPSFPFYRSSENRNWQSLGQRNAKEKAVAHTSQQKRDSESIFTLLDIFAVLGRIWFWFVPSVSMCVCVCVCVWVSVCVGDAFDKEAKWNDFVDKI